MELSQLRMFKKITDNGGIARAAEQLHCVPSNITTRIKNLEEELGEPLFIRKGRGLVLSPSGEVFLAYTNKILSLCEEAKRSIGAGSSPIGTLSIGAIESSATSRLPKLLSSYHLSYPAVNIEFSTDTWKNLENKVVKHELDGAIIAVKTAHPSLHCEAIYWEDLAVIASSALNNIESPESLVGKNIYMWPEGCPYRKALENWLSESGISVPITSIASYGTILGCVSSGAGVSLVPKGVFEQFKLIGGIKGYSFAALKPIHNYFIWNKETGHHPAKEAFLTLIKSEM
ncbi:HTH-type transcriptional regulator GltR [Marinomonas spartinae]|uniref:HTH-type transcriptional regulator GltR n=1 Tax=Marinomonas spartinae TaxID=1792290 RepID=A0A1A8TTI9_9GAMM|nr:LysR family transcriptional regulator [Marinomonas spartinae]SBS37771.1 HTH-type transcriptional regulator GltR [Marinomonas spartinae]